MADEIINEQISPDAKPLEETNPAEQEVAIEPEVEEQTAVKDPEVEQPNIDAEPAIVADGVPETAEEIPLIDAVEENPDLYEVQAADLNAYPELSQQGVQLYDKIVYGSVWVQEWSTAAKTSYTKQPWPRNITEVKNPITFKE